MDISKIAVGGEAYNLKDTKGRAEVASLEERVFGKEGELIKKATHYENVWAMKKDLTLEIGVTAATNGYHAPSDGGDSAYLIKEKREYNDVGFVLDNGLFAKLIFSANDAINIKKLGACAWGETTPASKHYSRLESLQKDYPLAISLDDEMDLLALEQAINVFNNVFIQGGGYKINRTLTISKAIVIRGGGIRTAQLQYIGTGNMFNITSNHVNISDIYFYGAFETGTVGSTNTSTCISAHGTNYGEYKNIHIAGFNYGIDFGENSWVNTVKHCFIHYCNNGVYGSVEFNMIDISNCTITYCGYGVRVGGGRTITVQECTIERCTYGVYKSNDGDVIVRGCYFELNATASIYGGYGNTAPNLVLVENCGFFTDVESETFIRYNTNIKSVLTICNNNFVCANALATAGKTIYCMTPQSSGTQATITFENNYLSDGCAVGVGVSNRSDYTQNGKNIVYNGSANLSSAMTTNNRTIRFEFVADGTITLPDFSAFNNPHEVCKFVAYNYSGIENQERSMTIDATASGAKIAGLSQIFANVVYSVYYIGKHTDGTNHILVAR